MTTVLGNIVLFVTVLYNLHVSSSDIITGTTSNVVGSVLNALGLNSSQCILPEELCTIEVLDKLEEILKTGPSLIDDIAELEKTDFLEKYRAGEKNEDKDLSITQLISKYGYEVETFTIETEDGYLIALHRIPGNGDSVLLVNGISCSAVDWLTIGRESALPCLLADQGYDVWLISNRGSTEESQGHVRLTLPKDDKQYWDFSWDEMGRYDLPATIDFILKETGKPKLKYVGFSQGTTAFYVMASERPEYNEKISMMVSLAPVAWGSNIKSPLLITFIKYLDAIRNIGFNRFNATNPLVQLVTDRICGTSPLAVIVCYTLVSSIFGFDYTQVNATQMPVIFGHYPSSFATKQLIHYGQAYNSGKFRRYDYNAPDQNMAVYGSEIPPDYPVEKISTPVALFYSTANDWVSDYEDVLILKSKLPNVVDFYNIPYNQWTHFDHIWAKDVKKYAYDRVLELFQKY